MGLWAAVLLFLAVTFVAIMIARPREVGDEPLPFLIVVPLAVILAPLTAMGAWDMWKQRRRGLCMAAAIANLPLLGAGTFFGVLALVVLLRPGTRALFECSQTRR